ncbi:MAG: acetyl-CoA C-acetyltransferase [Acidimicrobiaceae bacterium]
MIAGVGSVQQHPTAPADGCEPVELMIAAVNKAADDAGSRALLDRIGLVLVPKGIWGYPDPGRLVAQRVGAARATTVLAEIGVLQTTLLARAAAAVAAGDVEVALVVGGEAKHRVRLAARAGETLTGTAQPGAAPDDLLLPSGEIITRLEIERGLAVPACQYALVESALRHASGRTVEEHSAHLGALWARFNEVAQANPDAWDRQPLDAEQISDPASPGNRMVAAPYTRRLCSQWDVDQAVALLLCSQDTARALGVEPERVVFPHAVVESNVMTPLTARRELHRCVAFGLAGERLRAVTSLAPRDADHVDLYSCFPAAVQVQANELGIDLDRQLTVTGGMTFAAGPLNSYALHAIATMVGVLREDRGATGLVTAVSGMLTKQGMVLLGTEPPAPGFCSEDVSDDARRMTDTLAVVDQLDGPARVVGCTVAHSGPVAAQAIAVVESPGGQRTIATSTDTTLLAAMTDEDWCGRTVRIDGAILHPV